MIEECSVIISVRLCYGPSILDDCCLCCRPVGTSRMTGCVRTPARASCATTPTCTSWYPTHMESTTLGPPVSRAAHVRMTINRETNPPFFTFSSQSFAFTLLLDIYILLPYVKSMHCSCCLDSQDKLNKSGRPHLPIWNTWSMNMSFFTLQYAEQMPRLSFRVVRHSVVTVCLSLIINCINMKRKWLSFRSC